MESFLITSTNGVSEWKYNFSEVQLEMNRLESKGVVSNVKVQKFEDNILIKNLVYSYNGVNWEKTI